MKKQTIAPQKNSFRMGFSAPCHEEGFKYAPYELNQKMEWLEEHYYEVIRFRTLQGLLLQADSSNRPIILDELKRIALLIDGSILL